MVGRLLLLLSLAGLAGCDVRTPPAPGTSSTRDPFGRSSTPVAGTAEPGYESARALVVGVSDYRSGTLGSLQGPPFDAAEVAEVLASRFGFRVDLLTDRPPVVPPPPGVAADIRPVTLEALAAKLEAQSVSPKGAFLFYFAGHGLPRHLVPADAALPSPSDPSTWRNVLPFEALAAKLRAIDAHHTLAILDCCFSGSALADDGGFKKAVGTLGQPAIRASEKDNLGRVFNRRAFQVLTAGAGGETVGDLAEVSKRYAELNKDLEGHSPFTGVLLQGLRGLTGRADGRIPASDLGHYLSHTLVNENESFRARQAPRFGTFGGEGDFLFIPCVKVLNPRLVAPLYMAGPEYARLRESAADALEQFLEGAAPADRPELVASAVPHLVRLLRDPSPEPRRTAARVLANLADDRIPAFRGAAVPLRTLLADAKEDRAARGAAARALGSLPAFAEPETVSAIEAYAAELEAVWIARLGNRPEPPEIRAGRKPVEGEGIVRAEARRATAEWLVNEGLRILEDRDRRHERGKALVQRAERYLAEHRAMEARFAAGAAIGLTGQPELLWPGSPEWARVESMLMTAPDVRLLWSVGGRRGHHLKRVEHVAFSANGRRLASVDDEGGVAMWDGASGRLEHRLPPAERPHVITWSPDGETLALAESKRIRRIARGAEIAALPVAAGRSLGFSADGRRLAVGTEAGLVRVVDMNSGAITDLRGHENAIAFVGFLDEVLLSVSSSGEIRRWKDGAPAGRAEVNGASAAALYGDRLLVHTNSGIEVRDAASGDLKSACNFESATLQDVLIPTPDGGSVLVCDGDQVVRVRLSDGSRLWTWRPERGHVTCASSDGRRVAVSLRQEIRLLDLETGRELLAAAPHTTGCGDARFTPDGRRFVTFDLDRLRVWSTATGALERELDTGVGAVSAFALHPDSGRIAVATYLFRILPGRPTERVTRIRLHSLEDGRLVAESADLPGPVPAVEFAPNGDHLFAAVGQTVLKLDPAKLAVAAASPPGGRILGLAVAPAGDLVAITEDTGRARVLAAWTLVERWMKSTPGLLESPAFDPTGMLLAAACHDGTVRVWAVPTGEEFRRLDASKEAVTRVRWTHDGRQLAIGGFDDDVRFFDLADSKETLRLSAGDAVTAIDLSPDGTLVLAGTNAGPVRLWDIGPAGIRMRLRAPAANAIQSIAWMPGGRELAAGGVGGVLIADVETGSYQRQLPMNGIVMFVSVSDDGACLAASLKSGDVEVWDLGKLKRRAAFRVAENHHIETRFVGADLWTRVKGPGTVQRWNLEGGLQETFGEGRPGPFPPALIGVPVPTPDGRQILETDFNGMRLVEKDGGAVVWTYPGTDWGWVSQIAFTPDGRRLVTVHGDRRINVWDLATGRFLHRVFVELAGDLVMHPSEPRLALRTPEGEVVLADVEPGTPPPGALAGRLAIAKEDVIVVEAPFAGLGDVQPAPIGDVSPSSLPGLLRAKASPETLARRYQSASNLEAAVSMLAPCPPESSRPWRLAAVQAIEMEIQRLLRLKQVNEAGWRYRQAERLGADPSKYRRVFDVMDAFLEGDLAKAAAGLEVWSGLPESTHLLLQIATCRRLKDAEREKAALDAARAVRPGVTREFTWDVVSWYEGRISEEELYKLARSSATAPGVALGEFHFYVGLDRLAKDDPAGAERHFTDCHKFLRTGVEAQLAWSELRRLRAAREAAPADPN